MSNEVFEDGDKPDPTVIVTRQDFARTLSAVKERAGLTVRDVAKAVDVPVGTVGGYFSGRHLPGVKPPTLLSDILRVCGVTDPVEVTEWVNALNRVRRAPGRRPAGAPVPYRGLASFQPEDAEWFYGRETLTETLVARLTERPGSGLFMVVGPSGSGKSSLLRAGLIPVIQAGELVAGSEQWKPILFTPGTRPIDDFARHLAVIAGISEEKAIADIRRDPKHSRELLRQAVHAVTSGGIGPATDLRALVVVDQFEQMFIECADEAEQRIFISALHAAGTEIDPGDADSGTPDDHGALAPALVVLGMRADFYPHAMRFPTLTAALQDAQLTVGPMSETELRRAIIEPAHKAKIEIEEGLLELLLRDLATSSRDVTAAHDPGALPLLSHALLSTWQRGSRGTLTIADYQAIGGIRGAVADTAEDVYRSFDKPQQDITRKIFLRLIHIDDSTVDIRRRARTSELLDDRTDSDTAGLVQLVLDGFIERRLLTVDADTVEITHDALLHAWPRLRDWLNSDRAGLQTHRQLTFAAQSWADLGRDSTALYRGTRLAVAGEWVADPRHYADLNPLEREFLDASSRQEMEERRLERRRTHRLYKLLAALSVLLVLAGVLTGYSVQQRAEANSQRDLAISREVSIKANRIRDSDPDLAMQLSLAAFRIAPTEEARASLLDSSATPPVTRILGFPGVMQTIAVARDGTLMAAAGADRTIRLWSLAAPGRPVPLGAPLTGHTDTVYSIAFSPDGRILVSGSGDKTLRLWDVADPDRPRPLGPLPTGSPTNTVYSVAFSPDGRTLAAGSADNTIRLWDVSNLDNRGQPVPLIAEVTGMRGYVQSVAFSPDGHTLAAGSADKTVRLWDVTKPVQPIPLGDPLTGPTKTVFTVAFSPDGRTLAAGSADRTVWTWNITTPRIPTPLGPPLADATGWVNAVAFSLDGRFLAAGSSDDTVKVWDLTTRRLSTVLRHPGPVTAIVFRTDHTIATAAADGVARVWAVPGPVIISPTDVVNVGFTPDGHSLAVAGSSAANSLGLWDISDPVRPLLRGQPVMGPPEHGPFSGSLAVAPDGRIVAVGGSDGTVHLWNTSDPQQPVPLGPPLTGPTQTSQSIAFSPDGRIVAAGGNDSTVWLWDISQPSHPRHIVTLTGPGNFVYSVAFSPNGRTLAAGSVDQTVRLWDVTDPQHPAVLGLPLTGPASYVYSITFSPDGRTLAAGSADKTVWLWNVTEPGHPLHLATLAGPSNYVYSVAFSPDGRTLAAGSSDKTVWLWDTTHPGRPQHLATLTSPAEAIYSVAFNSNGMLAAGSEDHTIRLWATDPDRVAASICSTVGDPITSAEWQQYIPGKPYQLPCRRSR